MQSLLRKNPIVEWQMTRSVPDLVCVRAKLRRESSGCEIGSTQSINQLVGRSCVSAVSVCMLGILLSSLAFGTHSKFSDQRTQIQKSRRVILHGLEDETPCHHRCNVSAIIVATVQRLTPSSSQRCNVSSHYRCNVATSHAIIVVTLQRLMPLSSRCCNVSSHHCRDFSDLLSPFQLRKQLEPRNLCKLGTKLLAD